MGGNIIINNPHLYYYYKNSFLKTLRPNEFFLKIKSIPICQVAQCQNVAFMITFTSTKLVVNATSH